MIIGFTRGVFDLFHIGHLSFLKKAKKHCDKLIVGVHTDEFIKSNGNSSIINYLERSEIIRSLDQVDAVIPISFSDDINLCKKLKVNIFFVGDNWLKINNNLKQKITISDFTNFSIEFYHIPYSKGSSSKLLNQTLKLLKKNN